MNIRKPVDYSAMYASLDTLMAAGLPQMKLYCEIGSLVSSRAEKGSAVAAAEYLRETYPEAHGFSPRNLRRMRDFYRMYQDDSQQIELAMWVGWTQNVVIMEADLTMDERVWYLKATLFFVWSKLELTRRIAANAHLEILLDSVDSVCYTETVESAQENDNDQNTICLPRQYLEKS